MEQAQTVARELLQINAIKLSPQSPFTWASGLRSPIYCDNRTVLSYPVSRRLVIDAFVQQAESFRPFDLVAGVATAGIAHGVLLAERMNLPFVYVRSKAKEHGRRNQIEGVVQAGERVLVVEDLISTGGSSLVAVEALRDAGCTVVGVVAIFSYGFTEAEAAFREAACPFQTLTNYDILLQEATATGRITPADQEILREWRHSPRAWSESRAGL